MRKSQNQKGVAVVEFALVLPMLLVLAFGIIEFSLILFDKAVITNASREGARAGIVAGDPRVSDAAIIGVANNYFSTHVVSLGPNNPSSVTVAREGNNFGDDLTVTVSYSYGFLVLPNFVTGITGPLTLTATTVMKME